MRRLPSLLKTASILPELFFRRNNCGDGLRTLQEAYISLSVVKMRLLDCDQLLVDLLRNHLLLAGFWCHPENKVDKPRP